MFQLLKSEVKNISSIQASESWFRLSDKPKSSALLFFGTEAGEHNSTMKWQGKKYKMWMNEWEEEHYRTNWWEISAANGLRYYLVVLLITPRQYPLVDVKCLTQTNNAYSGVNAS